MKVWSELKTGTDGKLYGIRYLLTDTEADHLQKVGVVGELLEVISMKQAADQTMAAFERDQMVYEGGQVQ
jgi:hypothetical protein